MVIIGYLPSRWDSGAEASEPLMDEMPTVGTSWSVSSAAVVRSVAHHHLARLPSAPARSPNRSSGPKRLARQKWRTDRPHLALRGTSWTRRGPTCCSLLLDDAYVVFARPKALGRAAGSLGGEPLLHGLNRWLRGHEPSNPKSTSRRSKRVPSLSHHNCHSATTGSSLGTAATTASVRT